MHQKQKKNYQYGAFITARNSFQKFKKKAVLGVLILVLIIGAGAAAFKQFYKPQPQSVAQVKPTENLLPAWWLKDYFGSSVCESKVCEPTEDPDQDKLTNAQEFYYHTNPHNPHTAKDKMTDGQLVAAGFDPSRSGRMTFDEVASDDNILGESIVYDKDIRELVSESQDLSKVKVPILADGEFTVIKEVNEEVYKKYIHDFNLVIAKYFSKDDLSRLNDTIKNSDGSDLMSVKTKLLLLSNELKTVPVPARFLYFHKYSISVYNLTALVMMGPPVDLLGGSTKGADLWYDQTQQLFVIQQKLELEKDSLNKEFGL